MLKVVCGFTYLRWEPIVLALWVWSSCLGQVNKLAMAMSTYLDQILCSHASIQDPVFVLDFFSLTPTLPFTTPQHSHTTSTLPHSHTHSLTHSHNVTLTSLQFSAEGRQPRISGPISTIATPSWVSTMVSILTLLRSNTIIHTFHRHAPLVALVPRPPAMRTWDNLLRDLVAVPKRS